MSEDGPVPIPVATDEEIVEFIKRYGKTFDLATDEYRRDPFIADIREGKNDPIYNAHSYHTKVPPRAIIPYILHYTEPGDIVLDPFCGSGMTGVAALICGNPPEDLLKVVPRARKGARRAILNDLSPAACHIAYNYCTPVDVDALKKEFERIKATVKEEIAWLYGTEHYEPAVGIYDPTNAEVAHRLKNPPPDAFKFIRISDQEPTWELVNRTEVERRMGSKALGTQPLPREIDRFICIPATIQYTIWSDVFKCQGMVTIEDQTGRINKSTGRPVIKKIRRPRGCGNEIVLWEVARVNVAEKIQNGFSCPVCNTEWKKLALRLIDSRPVVTNYSFTGLRSRTRSGELEPVEMRTERPTTLSEVKHITTISGLQIPNWFPREPIDLGREMMRHGLLKRGLKTVDEFYTRRNLWGLAALWHQASVVPSMRLACMLRFALTSIMTFVSKKQSYGGGGGGLSATLYIAAFQQEKNVLEVFDRKMKDLLEGISMHNAMSQQGGILFSMGSAAHLSIPEASVDYIFTDPPFGSNIFYSDCSLLWES
jgi:hypothetical protein